LLLATGLSVLYAKAWFFSKHSIVIVPGGYLDCLLSWDVSGNPMLVISLHVGFLLIILAIVFFNDLLQRTVFIVWTNQQKLRLLFLLGAFFCLFLIVILVVVFLFSNWICLLEREARLTGTSVLFFSDGWGFEIHKTYWSDAELYFETVRYLDDITKLFISVDEIKIMFPEFHHSVRDLREFINTTVADRQVAFLLHGLGWCAATYMTCISVYFV